MAMLEMNFEIMSEEAESKLIEDDNKSPNLPSEVRSFYKELKKNINITEDTNDGKKTFRFNIPIRFSTSLLGIKGRPTFNHHDKEHVEEVRNLCAQCLAWVKSRHLFIFWKDRYLEDFQRLQAEQLTRKKSPILEAFITMLTKDD